MGPAGTGTVRGCVFFDDFFAGATTNEKITAMNAWAQAHGGLPTPFVIFDNKKYDHSVPIELWSGLRCEGNGGMPAREFSRGCVLNYVGATGTAQLKFVGPQTFQSYPADGSPRDITFRGIQFSAGLDKHFIEPSTVISGHTLWMTEFSNCGWVGFKTLWKGFGDGCHFATGTSHIQAGAETLIDVGGSECVIFGNEAKGFWDSGNATWAASGLPWMRLQLQKSIVGSAMVTNRKNTRCIEVYGVAANLRFIGTDLDCQSSDPAYGSQFLITNGKNIVISNVSFKGGMTNPTAGPGGATNNRAFIHVNGGRGIVIEANAFERAGNVLPPTNTPLVFTAAAVPLGGVAFGWNGWADYQGIVRETATGQIVTCDPRIVYTTGALASSAAHDPPVVRDVYSEYRSAIEDGRWAEWFNDTGGV